MTLQSTSITHPSEHTAPSPTRGPGGTLGRLPRLLRPDSRLLTYYGLSSLVAGPFFFIPFLVLYLRYRTMRYVVEDEGITMRWGALFRREISLTYARIQDIHLSSNVIERWLGLAKIQVQTASGSATAEMTIEGMLAFEEMRDFLYARMRGAREPSGTEQGQITGGEMAELTGLLREIAAEVRGLRTALPVRTGGANG